MNVETPRTPIRSREETPPPKPAPADDDFASQYANFDEASVAPGDTEHFSQPIDVPAPARRDDSAALKAAEARVPATIRDYLAAQFQVRFDRYVPAGEVRIFSSRGEICSAETQDSEPDDPELSPELDD